MSKQTISISISGDVLKNIDNECSEKNVKRSVLIERKLLELETIKKWLNINQVVEVQDQKSNPNEISEEKKEKEAYNTMLDGLIGDSVNSMKE